MHRSLFAFVVGSVVGLVGPVIAPVYGQVPGASGTQRLTANDSVMIRRLLGGKDASNLTPAEVVDRLRQSGITREQARVRLRQLGYDPSLVDPYFDAMEGGGGPPRGQRSDEQAEALDQLGVSVAAQAQTGDSVAALAGVSPVFPESSDPCAAAGPGVPVIFGRDVFQRESSEFEAPEWGPVDPDYRLGPTDEVALVLTGDVEAIYTLSVTREGYIVIPDVGQVFVAGLTLARLEDRLYDRLGRVYSGVRRGGEATTRFQVSLGRLRKKQVYVIGEVERPSAYTLSGSATVFQALYEAGGPRCTGSFRSITVYRGGERVAVVDVYEYLLEGRSTSDIRLEHGDRVFIPPYERRATVKGAVRRPGVYELKEGDDLRDAIAFAGGLTADAVVRRIQIDRIVPPEQRRPGVDRVLIDVDLSRVLREDAEPVGLRDGDVVEAFTVSDERRNRVVVAGEVERPGVYEWIRGMTLWDLIEQADGLSERAYTPRAHVYRLVEADGSRRLIRTPVLADTSGAPLQDVVLADRDSVVVFSRSELRNEGFVTLDGFVKRPGTYPFAEGMSVQDLILAAGGFIEGAETSVAEVARMPDHAERGDTTAVVVRVPLAGPAMEGAGDAAAVKAGAPLTDDGVPVWVPEPDEHWLRTGDRVFIRKAVGYEPPRAVRITGDVVVPGTYVLQTRDERIVDLIRRAGGLTDEAYAPGLQLYRNGKLVATDLLAAQRDESSRYNLALQPGDSVHVPQYDPTVLVAGAVAFETLVLYEPGKSLDYYVNQAGGYLDFADMDRVTVTYMDGERATVEKTLKLFRRTPAIMPGSTIRVPEKPPSERGMSVVDRILTRATGILTSVLTIWLTVEALRGEG